MKSILSVQNAWNKSLIHDVLVRMSAASNLSIVDSEALQTPKKTRTSGGFVSAKSAAFHKTLFREVPPPGHSPPQR
ncbi:unnamed protein product [Pylaiella littoralis]